MEVSDNAIEIIKEFEGFRLNAYIDPVGIPTIGYGTIRYPDGKRVRMGDSVSQAEAEGFLKFDCEGVAADLTAAVQGIALNQNQFDALVSFCYNLGLGAFQGSTLLRKLKQNEFVAAAAEFDRWNKGTVNGVKQELEGLIKRRAKERKLFEEAGTAAVVEREKPSDQERVTLLTGFREGDDVLAVASDGAGATIEILKLADTLPDTFVALLGLYPNLKSFTFAAAGEALPDGEPVPFTGLARPIAPVTGAPPPPDSILSLGSEDTEAEVQNSVTAMQRRLKDLGYFEGKIDGVFSAATDDAVRDFQADYFGRSEADGKVGPRTWAKLFGDTPATGASPGVATPGQHYLKLTKTDRKDHNGLVKLILAYYKDGVLVDSVDVCSGQARKQTFRIGKESRSGSMEPLPEGLWFVNNIEWADGKDNYSGAVWNNGLGPVKIRLDYKKPDRTSRSAIEIHIDWNRSGAPGTAGCVGVQNVADYRKLVGWLRETDPRSLFVDWDLGTCPSP